MKYRLYFADLETFSINNKHYAIAFGLKFEEIYFTENIFKIKRKNLNLDEAELNILETEIIAKSLELLFSLHRTGYKNIIFMHNFMKFDIIPFLRYLTKTKDMTIQVISRDKVIYQLRIKKGNKILYFRDSYQLTMQSMEASAKSFNCKFSKTNFNFNILSNYKLLSENKIKLLSYLKNDCDLLQEVITKFNLLLNQNFNFDLFKGLTLPSLSYKIFKKTCPADFVKIKDINKWKDKLIRSSYYGGAVDIYKPWAKNIYHYDVNSLYQHIMQTKPMPTGYGRYHKFSPGEKLDNFFGFISCKVYCPEYIVQPLLPIHYKNKFLRPCGT